MRIAIVAESFLPHMNGVTHSLLQVIAHLRRRGDDVLVVAPTSSWLEDTAPATVEGYPVYRLPSIPLRGYPNVRVAAGTVAPDPPGRLPASRPDVVHLASPFILGWRAVQAAHQLGMPTVSVYQTEVPGLRRPLRASLAGGTGPGSGWSSIHTASTLTLAPSIFALDQLRGRGIPRRTCGGAAWTPAGSTRRSATPAGGLP